MCETVPVVPESVVPSPQSIVTGPVDSMLNDIVLFPSPYPAVPTLHSVVNAGATIQAEPFQVYPALQLIFDVSPPIVTVPSVHVAVAVYSVNPFGGAPMVVLVTG